MSGWVKLHRQFAEWEWYTDDKCFRVFIHLLLKCNHKTVNWRGETIERGSTITSLSKLAVEVGMSLQSLRTTLSKLEKTGEINRQSTSKLTKITVCNYKSYQDEQHDNNTQTNKPTTNQQQTSNKPLTTNKNDKNENTVKNEIKELLDPYGFPVKVLTSIESFQCNLKRLGVKFSKSLSGWKLFFNKVKRSIELFGEDVTIKSIQDAEEGNWKTIYDPKGDKANTRERNDKQTQFSYTDEEREQVLDELFGEVKK